MPELRGKTFPDFTETTVDTDTIRYKDKNREKQRQKMLAEQKDKDKTPFPKKQFIKNQAWSKQKSRTERRKKRAAKRKHHEVFKLNVMTNPIASVGWIYSYFFCVCVWLQGSDTDDEDLKELLNDTRLLKKLKKGQISEEDFEKQITSQPKAKHKLGAPSHVSSGGEDV